MSSQGKTTITATATQILAANADRRSLWIQNTGNQKVYIGFNSSLTTDNPYLTPLASRDTEPLLGDYRGAIWGICDSGQSSSVSYLELTQ